MCAKTTSLESLACVHPYAAGLDIGSREIWAAVPPDRGGETVRCFATFTPDLEALADWLAQCSVDTVAMESTGVYWIPIFEILEARGFTVYLVNARHVKHVPGRKSDVLDCQWLRKLHSLGLLSGSFRPEADICALRALLRHRAQLIQHRAPHILHMQKALQQMNLQLHHLLSDITGVTGQKILRAIVDGERHPVTLARFRHPSCQSSEETIAKAQDFMGHSPNECLQATQLLARSCRPGNGTLSTAPRKRGHSICLTCTCRIRGCCYWMLKQKEQLFRYEKDLG